MTHAEELLGSVYYSLGSLRNEQTERYKDFVDRHDMLIKELRLDFVVRQNMVIKELRLILYALCGIALGVLMHWHRWL